MASRSEVEERDKLPMFFYIPSFLSFRLLAEALKVIVKVLCGYGVNAVVMFKPDIFTILNIYSGKANIKPYIFRFSGNTLSMNIF